jgi:hypothetical protein
LRRTLPAAVPVAETEKEVEERGGGPALWFFDGGHDGWQPCGAEMSRVLNALFVKGVAEFSWGSRRYDFLFHFSKKEILLIFLFYFCVRVLF